MTYSRSALVLILALAGCGADMGHIDVGVTASTQLAQGSEPGADAPHLLVTIDRVDVHVAGSGDVADDDGDAGEVEDAKDTEDGGGWTTVFTGPLEIDLADAVSSEAFLGGADVPAGKITQIRLVLASDATLVIGEEHRSVDCPSCDRSGLKIVTRGSLSVAEGEHLHLVAVFDTLASLAADPGLTRMSPVIRLEKAQSPARP